MDEKRLTFQICPMSRINSYYCGQKFRIQDGVKQTIYWIASSSRVKISSLICWHMRNDIVSNQKERNHPASQIAWISPQWVLLKVPDLFLQVCQMISIQTKISCTTYRVNISTKQTSLCLPLYLPLNELHSTTLTSSFSDWLQQSESAGK